MKKVLLLVLLAVIGVLAWYFFQTKPKPDNETPKQQPVAVSAHSAGFNQSIDQTLNTYYSLSEAFVNWDSAAVTANATALKARLDSLQLDELKKDTVVYQTATSSLDQFQNDLKVMAGKENLTAKRQAYNSFSQNFYDLLRTVQYDNGKVYLQQCPMAFNDSEPGNWLSKTEDIRNPYLGLHHPKYKGSMIECGETKDTLNFAATTK